MRLAWRLGKTVEEAGRMPAAELADWAAFERVEGPIGPEREDLQAASVVATILNLFRKKDAEALTAADVAPDWGKERKKQRRKKTAGAWVAYAARLKAERLARLAEADKEGG